ncbi:uncharacterized protein B0H64DRAFT_110836 [Chaetomium fimeti]|uniref:Uncharacterized protein n=1 Tax=Chaetomium fimeti TaxID=1854472 RepID=A0AAE0HHY6_9PEZI|nr:hypothetical protein B0H64DRAFT_110836 [Chaetomium fimeti]
MPSLYTITEPHPTVPQNSYTHSGRGGLGNFFRAPATTSPSGVPTPSTTTTATTSTTSSTRRFYSGRGGAGNARAAPALAFDEDELARRESATATAMVGHVGRGGAGNVFYSSSSAAAVAKDAGVDDAGEALGRRDSASTEGSARSSASSSLAGLWGRVKSAGR